MAICTSVGVQKMPPPLPEGIPKDMARVLSSCFEVDPGQRPSALRVLKVGGNGLAEQLGIGIEGLLGGTNEVQVMWVCKAVAKLCLDTCLYGLRWPKGKGLVHLSDQGG
jgi:hypothetical protein